MLRVVTRMRSLTRAPTRFFTDDREKKARLEIDPYDNPLLDTESTKPNTGNTLQVEPWPRRKLKELYMITLERLKEFPEDFGYRIVMEECIRFRLKVVESNTDHAEIERIIGFGQVEELIEAARREMSLIEIFMNHKAWEPDELSEGNYQVLEKMKNVPFGDFDFVHTQQPPPKNSNRS